VLKAAQILSDEGIAEPILLGRRDKILAMIEEYQLGIEDVLIINPREDDDKCNYFAECYWQKRKRNGVTLYEATKLMKNREYFGCMMVDCDEADVVISGQTVKYASAVRPILEIIGREEGVKTVHGLYVLLTKSGPLFMADTTINEEPTADQIVEITVNTARSLKRTNLVPKVALLSYSNFGSHKGAVPKKMHKAVDFA
jgi:malate dehydrogenase (oxaloacetate-decarboxylating)(NADP+)